MSRRNRRGCYRTDLREAMEDFDQDWRAEREIALSEIALADETDRQVETESDTLRTECETLRAELDVAKARVETLQIVCRSRWSTASLVMLVFGAAALFGFIGYIARIMTE